MPHVTPALCDAPCVRESACACALACACVRENLPPADPPHGRQGSEVSASGALHVRRHVCRHVCRRTALVASGVTSPATLASCVQRAERGVQRLRQGRQARPAPPCGGGGIPFPWAARGEEAPRSSGVGKVVFEGGWRGGGARGCRGLVPRRQLSQVPALPRRLCPPKSLHVSHTCRQSKNAARERWSRGRGEGAARHRAAKPSECRPKVVTRVCVGSVNLGHHATARHDSHGARQGCLARWPLILPFISRSCRVPAVSAVVHFCGICRLVHRFVYDHFERLPPACAYHS